MRSRLIITALLACLLAGANEATAQGQRRRHEPKEQRVECLSKDKLAILYNKVKKASFDGDRVDLIEVACLGKVYFTCEQCARIIGTITFGDNKLAALRHMAPHIIDPRHAYLIYEKFSFASEKDEAARIMGG